jgi:hypothetical protein
MKEETSHSSNCRKYGNFWKPRTWNKIYLESSVVLLRMKLSEEVHKMSLILFQHFWKLILIVCLFGFFFFVYCFTSHSRIFHLYGWRTANLVLCSTLRTFEQGGIFIAPYLLWHGASIFPVFIWRPTHLIAFCDSQGDAEDLFLPDPHRMRMHIQIPLSNIEV